MRQQGKRKDQIDFSEYMVSLSIIGLILTVIAIKVINILK